MRVRVKKPTDLFETAESQNLPSVSANSIQYQSTKPLLDNLYWMVTASTTESTITKGLEATTEAVLHEYISNKFQHDKGNDTTLDTSQNPNKTDSDLDTSEEPKETINFEKALTDMMKEFITDSESSGNTKVERENITLTTIATTVMDTEETTGQTQDFEVTTLPVSAESHTSLEALTDLAAVSDYFEPTTENILITTNNEQELESNPPKILGTSTTTEISLETEICYRGRCVKTKSENDSDLLTAE